MEPVETIVVGLEFDETKTYAADRAALLGVMFDADVQPVHALDTLENRAQSTEKVNDLCERMRKAGARVLDPIILHGFADSVILSAANSCDANLIVIGARRKSLADRLIQGATATKVVHKAVMPVWAVHSEEESKEIKTVLCPVDFSSYSEQALRTAVHLCMDWGAKLHVMHVITKHAKSSCRYDNKRLSEQFENFIYRATFGKLDAIDHLVEGGVSDVILNASKKEIHPDLVVMGAAGQGSILDTFIGNNADRILRKSKCCVLTVRHQDIFKLMHEEFESAEEAEDKALIDTSVEELARAVEKHYSRARDYLSRDMFDRALEEFQHCLDYDNMFSQAYEGIAEVYARLGKEDASAHYHELAMNRRRILWQQRVQADVRREHDFFSDRD